MSPDLNPIEHLCDVVERELCALDVHPTNVHKPQDAILSIWANISKECFQQLVESMPRRIKAALKAKGGQTQYYYGVPNNPLGWVYFLLLFHSQKKILHQFSIEQNIYPWIVIHFGTRQKLMGTVKRCGWVW